MERSCGAAQVLGSAPAGAEQGGGCGQGEHTQNWAAVEVRWGGTMTAGGGHCWQLSWAVGWQSSRIWSAGPGKKHPQPRRGPVRLAQGPDGEEKGFGESRASLWPWE